MNKDVPLILNNNNAVGVTDEVREMTWFYKIKAHTFCKTCKSVP